MHVVTDITDSDLMNTVCAAFCMGVKNLISDGRIEPMQKVYQSRGLSEVYFVNIQHRVGSFPFAVYRR